LPAFADDSDFVGVKRFGKSFEQAMTQESGPHLMKAALLIKDICGFANNKLLTCIQTFINHCAL
jgi:hypothetical protein